MKKLLLLSILLLVKPLAWSQNTGTVVIYGTGDRVMLPLIIDTQLKVRLGNARKVSLQLTAGEHQVESKFGSINPVLAVRVEAGETTYILRDFKRIGIGSLLMMKDPRTHMSLTLEHTNAPPDGDYKEEDVKQDVAASVARLPPYHEAAPSVSRIDAQPLSPEEIQEAVLQGRHTTDPRTVGVLLEDYQQQLGSALVQGQSVSGYSVRLYTAKQWIELQGALAKHEMRPFTKEDVLPAMRQKLLYVVASPSTPNDLTGKNMVAASNVQRVVLETGPSKVVTQPLTLEQSGTRVDSALRSASYAGMTATFPQPDISKPFAVIVIGDGYTKTFSVKDKNLPRLR